MQRSTFTKYWTFFVFEEVSSPKLEWKFIVIEPTFAFLSFGSLHLGILGFKSEQQ